ncbi:hypothetical protein [Pontibacter ummariensis]|nr:hypothetical protein [Pontibacter ummariensis]
MPVSLNYKFLMSIGAALALVTGVLGASLVSLLWGEAELVPLWGQQSIASHLVSFSVIVGFVLGWIATKATRKALLSKKVLPLHWHLKSQTVIDQLPARTWHRSLMLGLSGALLASLTLILFEAKRLSHLPYDKFVLLFSVYAVTLSVAITVMAVYRAMGDKTVQQVKP